MRVVVCDPGVGNVRSVVRAIERSLEGRPGTDRAHEVLVTNNPTHLSDADFVVVPGQGAFGPFARGIEGALGDALRQHIERERPYLGICMGMQVLFDSGDEAPGAAGLGIFRGHVRRLAPGIDPVTSRPYALPHMGWNTVNCPGESPRHFYFAHTYAAEPDDPSVIAGTTTYGDARIATMVRRGHVLGVQFHPEKSQREGARLLADFFRS